MGKGTPNWAVEAPIIWAVARGSPALFCALVALRKVENGGDGRQFGVLTVPAPTFEDQLEVAARSIRNHVERCRVKGLRVYDPVTGLFTEEFLRDFSQRWAPLGAGNDPNDLNAHHAGNLVAIAADVAGQLAAHAYTIAV